MAPVNPLIIPVGDRFLTLDQLATIERDTLPTLAPTDKGAIVAAVDTSGVKVAVEFGHTDHGWSADAVYQHDWNGDNALAGKIMYRW